MEFTRFDALVREARARQAGRFAPEDWELLESLPAAEADLQHVEDVLKIELPDKYKRFMRRYGGGAFLFLELLPVVSAGGDLVSVNRGDVRDPGFVAVAPVGTGDWWGFEVVDGKCGDSVSFWYHDERKVEASVDDFLDFVARRGLRVGE